MSINFDMEIYTNIIYARKHIAKKENVVLIQNHVLFFHIL